MMEETTESFDTSAETRKLEPAQSELEGVSQQDVQAISDRIATEVLLTDDALVLPPGYAHISLALVDAVFTIQLPYSQVRRVVQAYSLASGTQDEPLERRSDSSFQERGLDHFLNVTEGLSGEELANRFFAGSRSKTSGRLKCDVCVDAAKRLLAAEVQTSLDLHQKWSTDEAKLAWTGVHGLGGTTWQYFCSLNGLEEMKPDTMLIRFVSTTLGRRTNAAETDRLMREASSLLRQRFPELTHRSLDHTVWNFESGRLDPTEK